MKNLRGKVIFISGASRGIGKAIALRCAMDGAKIVIAAKTETPHPKLPGTIYTAAEEIRRLGGEALPIVCDIRNEQQVQAAIDQTVAKWGQIDILVNNASAINLTNTEETPIKRYDLMNQVNARGTYLLSQLALPHLKRANNPHILTLSPPLSFEARWFEPHVAYTIAKFGMSMCVLGMSAEFRKYGVAVNALWPRTAIDTAALAMIPGADEKSKLRKVEIMADSAYAILCQDSKAFTGNFLLDDDVLRSQGIKNLDVYSVTPGTKDFMPDFFIPDGYQSPPLPKRVLQKATAKL